MSTPTEQAPHHNDLFETKAIKLALGDQAYKTKISSTKSMVGHLLGAAGGVEFIACVKSIEDSFVHETAGLRTPDPECDLDYVMGGGVSMDVDCAISIPGLWRSQRQPACKEV